MLEQRQLLSAAPAALLSLDHGVGFSLAYVTARGGKSATHGHGRSRTAAAPTTTSQPTSDLTFTPFDDPTFSDADIGSPAVAGSASYSSGTYTVSGAGTDIWGTSDQFNFASQSFTGDGSIVAEINSQTNTNSAAKAGVMIRNDSTAGSAYAAAFVTPGQGVDFQWRSAAGGNTSDTLISGVTAPVWLKLTRSGDSFTAYYSTDGSTWTQIGSAETAAVSSNALAGLAVGSKNTATLSTATFTNLSFAAAPALPSGWSDGDIGSPADVGGATFDGTIWTVAGGGTDIWSTADQFNFASQSLTGDGSIVAEVNSQTNTNSGAKAGVMIRNDSTAGSAYAAAFITPSQGVDFQWRSAAGGTTADTLISGVTAPVWLKLARSGDSFTAYYSADGSTWTQIGTGHTVTVSSNALAGLAVGSKNTATLSTATFTNLSLAAAPALPSGWTDGDIGSPADVGGATFDGTTWTIAGGGTDIWSTADQFNFASQSFTGDGSIVAEVTSQTNTNSAAKAGVMIRSDSTAGSAYAAAFITPGQGVDFQWRSTAGGTTTDTLIGGITAPVWVKLTRIGQSFAAYYSTDGSTWTQIGSVQSADVASSALAGLAVGSKNAATLSTATFTNLSLTAAPPLPSGWSDADIGSATPPGYAGYDGTTVTIASTGVIGPNTFNSMYIGGTTDSFNTVYQPLGSNQQFVAEITSQEDVSALAKAGIMLRASTDPSDVFAGLFVTPGWGVAMLDRTASGADATSSGFDNSYSLKNGPLWVKLTTSGGIVTGFVSADGTNWSQIGQVTIDLGSSPLAGLAVDGGDGQSRGTASFTNFSLGTITTSTTIPEAPYDTYAEAYSGTDGRLVWEPTSGVDTYTIEQSADGGSTYTAVATVPGTANTYLPSELSPNTTYTYRLEATTGGVNSLNSETASLTTTSNETAGEYLMSAGTPEVMYNYFGDTMSVSVSSSLTYAASWEQAYFLDASGTVASPGIGLSFTVGNFEPTSSGTGYYGQSFGIVVSKDPGMGYNADAGAFDSYYPQTDVTQPTTTDPGFCAPCIGETSSAGTTDENDACITTTAGGGFSNIISFNSEGAINTGIAGLGTNMASLPSILQSGGPGSPVEVVTGGTFSTFDSAGGGNYSGLQGDTDTLVDNTSDGTFTLTNTSGDQTTFYDFSSSVPSYLQGTFKSSTMAGSGGATVQATNSQGFPTSILLTNAAGQDEELWTYAYTTGTGPNAGRLASVTQQTMVDGAWTTYRVDSYTYYAAGDPNGNPGDLESETLTDASGNVLENEYWRYYTPGESGGAPNALMYSFGPQSDARLQAAYPGTNIDTLTDAEVAPYADQFFAYNSQGQVTTRTMQGQGCSSCSGGLGTFTYTYSQSDNTPGYNSWSFKQIETMPDGTIQTTYSDIYGDAMLSVTEDPSTGLQEGSFYVYDSNGNQIMEAQPSAVNLPSSLSTIEAYPDLLNQTGTSAAGHPEFQYVNADTGLIDITDFYSATTATDSAPGGVAGYQQDTKIEQGDAGTPILQTSIDYYAHTADGTGGAIYPTADSTQYRNTDGTGAETTSYSYTFFTDSNQMQSQTTTLPVIDSAQNGNGVADSSTDVYDQNGNVIWSKDANGNITYNAYDADTQALIQTVQDVNTASLTTAESATIPTGWTTPTGGGADLTTTYQVDQQGRTTEMTDPDGNVTYTVYNDAIDPTTGFSNEVRTYPGWHYDSALGEYTTTGPVQVTRENDPGSYSESLSYAYTPVSGVTAPTGTDTITNIQSLSRSITNAAGQTIESDAYFDLSGLTYSAATQHLGTAGVNYYATTYGYDSEGNQDKVVDPTGTITRTEYDAFQRPISTWVGTDDTPASGYWSPTNNTSPSNMVEVSSTIYDNGGVGDANATEQIMYPGSGEAPRATLNYYDWQDRLVANKQGALVDSDGTPTPTDETDGVGRPITYTTYDNLGEAVEQQSFDGDGVTITTTDGVPNAPSSSLLTAQSTTSYDNQGRTYETQQYSVDPTTGSVSSTAETSLTYYDPAGQVIAQSSPTGEWTKGVYDGAGRVVSQYATDGGVVNDATPGYATAASVTNDIVLSESDTVYDADGNPIETIESDRLPAASTAATGALTSADARISYSGSWYDAANRDIADENAGTNGGTPWTRPSSPDASDATHLVTTYGYDAAGNQDTVTDPAGIVTQTSFDALGRQTETIADYTDGTPTDDSNQTTAFTYDGDGDILTQTAVEPTGTPNQTTAYSYGSGTGSGIFSNTLLAKVEYPDATTGSASTSPSDDVEYTYDALGEKISMTDQNGTTHQYSYDSLGRETLDAVTTLGTGVDGSVLALGTTYNPQGLPFAETSYSNANGTGVVNQDEDIYNGLGQLTGEYQSVSGPVTTSTTPEVQYSYSDPSTGSVQTSMTYPNGRVIDYTYNAGVDAAVGLVSGIADAAGSDAGNLQSYSYLGAGTIVGEVDGNGVTETTTLDNFGRTSELDYVNSSGTTTDDLQYGYDQDSNVLYQLNGVNGSFSQLYSYDSLDRLTGYQQGTLNGSDTSITGTPTASQTWAYDALGNQATVTTNGTATTNTTNSNNELTTSGSATLAYDNDGNTLTDENGQTYTYNAWNQMVGAKNAAGTTLATYTYDAQGRRITETSSGTTTDIYYSNNWQDIEERQAGTVTRQNVWGLGYVNQLVERDDNSTSGSLGISGSGLGERLYAQQDLNWSVVSLVDASGSVVQRATFTPYGTATFLTPSWSNTTDAYSVTVLFQGGHLETATGQYEFQARDYDPQAGTWKEPDPAGFINGLGLYLFADSNPVITLDSTGLDDAWNIQGTEVPGAGGTITLSGDDGNAIQGTVKVFKDASVQGTNISNGIVNELTTTKDEKACETAEWVQFITRTAVRKDGKPLPAKTAWYTTSFGYKRYIGGETYVDSTKNNEQSPFYDFDGESEQLGNVNAMADAPDPVVDDSPNKFKFSSQQVICDDYLVVVDKNNLSQSQTVKWHIHWEADFDNNDNETYSNIFGSKATNFGDQTSKGIWLVGYEEAQDPSEKTLIGPIYDTNPL